VKHPENREAKAAVAVVASAEEALYRAAEYNHDLAVVDLGLPGMSGLDVLRTLRLDARWAALPCLILTAAGQDAQYREAEALGVSEFMTKPFSPRRLYARALALTGTLDPDARDGAEVSP
jgi:DNA-binding response OmpR family regulator